jgi:tripartite-type tricarboxylate transporter receptor subunit TctC
MPPGVPAERVEAMRRAFDRTMKDPKMLADAKKRGFVVTGESGEALQAVIAELDATPKPIVEKARKAIGMK